MYGDRSEAMRIHYKIGDEETIQYVEVFSLYPFACKYLMLTIGHPVIHVDDACHDMQAMFLKDILMKCSILQQRQDRTL